MVNWLEGKVVENKQWSDDLFSLKIATELLTFKAGQFVNVGLVDKQDNKILARPYSLINCPQEPLLEIHFNVVKNGRLSPQLGSLKMGDTIQVSDRCSGLLTLDEIPDVKYLWLFATGTGIGPFLSNLKTSEPWTRFKKIILAYSVKTQKNLAYRTELDNLQMQYPEQFCFVPMITREKISDTLHSRITNSLKNGDLEQHAGLKLALDSNHVILCGNSKMISDATLLLEKRGLQRHTRRIPGQISIEKYY